MLILKVVPHIPRFLDVFVMIIIIIFIIIIFIIIIIIDSEIFVTPHTPRFLCVPSRPPG